MQLVFNREVLAEALKYVTKVASEKVQMSLPYRCVAIEVTPAVKKSSKAKVTFTCFDQSRMAQVSGIPVVAKKLKHVERFMLEAREFFAFVAASSAEEVVLELSSNGSALRVCTDAVIELPLVDEEKNAFPVRLVPKKKMHLADLDKTDFLDWCVLCSKFTSKDSTKPALGAIYVSPEGTLMGTDTRSAFMLKDLGVLGPAMLRSDLEPLLADFKTTGKLLYYFSGSKVKVQCVQFQKGNKIVWSVVPEGTFPAKAIRRVEKKHAAAKKLRFRVSKKALNGMLRRAAAVENEDVDALQFMRSEDGGALFRFPKCKGGRKFEETLLVKGTVPKKAVVVSRYGLASVLKMTLGEYLTFEVTSDLSLPVVVVAGKGKRFWVNRVKGA